MWVISNIFQNRMDNTQQLVFSLTSKSKEVPSSMLILLKSLMGGGKRGVNTC